LTLALGHAIYAHQIQSQIPEKLNDESSRFDGPDMTRLVTHAGFQWLSANEP
jgi:hypothetical protein